jgi:hypothetical protein
MATFEFTLLEDHHEDCVYRPIDDVVDIDTLRIEEGLAITTCGNDRIEFFGKFVLDASFLPCHREG